MLGFSALDSKCKVVQLLFLFEKSKYNGHTIIIKVSTFKFASYFKSKFFPFLLVKMGKKQGSGSGFTALRDTTQAPAHGMTPWSFP